MRENERKEREQAGEVFEDNDEDELSDEEQEDYDMDDKQALLPSTDDPRLWQVRVKKNHERIAVIALLNKSIAY
jgi:hypothetical protein